MSFLELATLGIALGADAFSVSVAIGTRQLKLAVIIKLSLLIGLFHILMTFLGINLGRLLYNFFGNYYFEETIDQITTVIASGLLMILGMIMIYEQLKEEESINYNLNLYGWTLIILPLSVSMDALSVGFSLGMLEINTVITSLTLGIIAGVLVIVGLLVGNKIGNLIANKAEVLGGVVLILLGIHFLLSIN
ncbi:manganese efflux pump MntP family protein [Natroniella sulfidigena]|uniref:manganese efflux pump MntP n=1 Tax=Natroniella sulfidigena TaxID=723921 RepID=UPI00200ADFF5|nr:manganese efflux pump MntP family protein [Natroniella sulfidigena]MCK8816409.1 manganese efflux pump MntP family protein [Natroniella sulfidigena]